MIDIIGKQILNDIKTLPGCDKAVIAGGFCRDAILNGDWKDVDIFVPAKGFKRFDLPKHYEWYTAPKESYEGQLLKQVLDILFLGSVRIQLIAYDLPEKDFGKELVSHFNYGIDQAWTEDGEKILYSDKFSEDMQNGQITLLKKCSVDDLPNVIDKFLRLKKKYPNQYFKFNCPNLYWKDSPAIGKQNIKEVKDWRRGRDFLKKAWWQNPVPPAPVPPNNFNQVFGQAAVDLGANPVQDAMNNLMQQAMNNAVDEGALDF